MTNDVYLYLLLIIVDISRGTQHLRTRSLQKRYMYGGNLLLYSLLMDLRTGLHLLVRSNQPDVDGEHDVHRCVERSEHVADSENHRLPVVVNGSII